jgi:predicted phosphate transport protein (TIGR00153 family)
MFAPSPIKPIEQHMHKTYLCAKQLLPFFEAVLNENWQEATKIRDNILALEMEADVIKRDLRLNLPTGLFLPVSRTELLELLRVQDKIANKAQDIAVLIVSRNTVIPAEIKDKLLPFVTRCLDAAKQACKAINELDELLETGFRGNEVKVVNEMILTLDKIEHDCDMKLTEIQHEIFLIEHKIPPVEVMFLYKIMQWIGDLAENAQTVGSRLQILIC